MAKQQRCGGVWMVCALFAVMAASIAGIADDARGQPGTVVGTQKISQTTGGFTGVLDVADLFGSGCGLLGDLDGDGVPDAVVGVFGDDDGGFNTGAAWILFLNADGTVKASQKISDTEGGLIGDLATNAVFAAQVDGIGDLDGDGHPDMIAGNLGDDDGGLDRGAVWILFLNSDGTVGGEQKISQTAGGFGGSLNNSDLFGHSVAGIGDLNGDGIRDVAVGSWFDDDGGTDRGAVWILFLNADGTVKDEQKISQTAGGFGGSLDDNDHFGTSVASMGDLDGDGVPDLAVGAEGDDDGAASAGAVWILFMNSDGTVNGEQKISMSSGGLTGPLDASDQFGSDVAGAGDLNADGVPDLAASAGGDDDGGENRGAVWMLFLNADGTVAAEQKISSTAGGLPPVLDNNDYFGSSVAVLGDVNGDGGIDLIAGALNDGDGATSAGAVYVLNLTPLSRLTLESVEPCQSDVFPGETGFQIEVDLWMRDLDENGLVASGFQAFVSFDDGLLSYRGDLSAYSTSPFTSHVTPIASAEAEAGVLTLDGSTLGGGTPTGDDSLLASLVFDVADGCEALFAFTEFGPLPFVSELSYNGMPIPTQLVSLNLPYDNVPPVIDCPAGIATNADVIVDGEVDPCMGAVVTFECTADDDCDGPVAVVCTPASGSFFDFGTTEVACTAVDACGNVAESFFDVVVSDLNTVKVDVRVHGSVATTRCIRFRLEDCSTYDVEVDLDADGVGVALFDLPCDDYRTQLLCAKDEQHTKSTSLVLVADDTCWLSATEVVLLPGDTDNDDDVDINDITWLVATFGMYSADGGCPWDGTKDADFSNNGVVGSEDYSLLSAQFLTIGECLPCVPPTVPSIVFDTRLSVPVSGLSPTQRAADLDRNGVFDWRDVARFERAHRLPDTLSRRMRGLR